MLFPKHFTPASALMERGSEIIFYFEGQPVRVYHYNGKMVGMTIEEAIDYLNQEPEAVQ